MNQHKEKINELLAKLIDKGYAVTKTGFGEYLVFSLFKNVLAEEVEKLVSDDWYVENVHVTIHKLELVKITYAG